MLLINGLLDFPGWSPLVLQMIKYSKDYRWQGNKLIDTCYTLWITLMWSNLLHVTIHPCEHKEMSL